MSDEYKALIAEREEMKAQLAHLLERNRELEKGNEALHCQLEILKAKNVDLTRMLGKEEGRSEAYAHCIDAMNGIQHEKKVGFCQC